ncbi:alpha/beta fold hydrolase [Prochlorococcus marinus]|uniref:Alpha/beta hydrolase n=1 Tax=Prochlorococcus marinus XMU1408 TaxID=2213228 RepID=A0A318R1K5_PROMR|nr:alpha/beta fold hydrolase [Prochlorococcus marinus]MBW3042855.1 alpha/beta hydrolase [Prochlorococcus marinus str. XMU1408]PYE00681.1 alpha/beta hydrolase [Prochlorococcus marinus XMU1408]
MKQFWNWENYQIAWQVEEEKNNTDIAIVLIHGFGACKDHWRFNQKNLSSIAPCYALDLIGFGDSSQPDSQLLYEKKTSKNFNYCFDNWSQQVFDFCNEIVKRPVLLIGNSIGGVIALNTSKKLSKKCLGIILIDCAQRTMDDKRLVEQSLLMRFLRPVIKTLVRQRFLSSNLFKNAANPNFISKILEVAYPSGGNIDEELIDILFKPTQRLGAPEAFRGFINLFDDYLAPDLLKDLSKPVHLIWGEKDPWEPVLEAKKWFDSFECVKSLKIIPNAGHCPHDEMPEKVNPIIKKIIQDAI